MSRILTALLVSAVMLTAARAELWTQGREYEPAPLDQYFMAMGPARVIDGDTIEVKGQNIRLFAIDSPERGQPGFSEAAAMLAGILRPSGVAICDCERGLRQRTSTRDCDYTYGRPVAVCRNADNIDIGLEMVRRGYAQARYGCAYAAQHREACRARRGLWQGYTGNCEPECDFKRR